MIRCKWCNLKNELYVKYHDEEWCKLNLDDKYLFEMLILESFQAGLSWECVLNKRESFRKAFDNFDIDKICNYDDGKIQELLENKNIIRNKLKVKATINNSKIFKNIQNEYGSFHNYLKIFTNDTIIYEINKTTNELSDAISKDLQKRGMKFVGSTIIYSYLQAIGIIYSHDKECFLYKQEDLGLSEILGINLDDEIQKKVYKNAKREYKVIDGANTRVKEFEEVKERTDNLINQLLVVWEDSVKATHTFLSNEEIEKIKIYVPQALKSIEHLIIVKNEKQRPIAFMGIEQNKLEMLFIKNSERRKGVGKQLLNYGIERYGINELAVNEQNPQAKGFYEHMGFKVYQRNELDDQGNPYPVLYMRLEK